MSEGPPFAYSTLGSLPGGGFGNFLCQNALGEILACFPCQDNNAASVNVYKLNAGVWDILATFGAGTLVYDLLTANNNPTTSGHVPYLVHNDDGTLYVFFGYYSRASASQMPVPATNTFSLSDYYLRSTDNGSTWTVSGGVSIPSVIIANMCYGSMTINTLSTPPTVVGAFVNGGDPNTNTATIVTTTFNTNPNVLPWITVNPTGYEKQYSVALTAHSDRIYAVGGYDGFASEFTVSRKVQYSANNGTNWTTSTITDLPVPMRGASLIVGANPPGSPVYLHAFPGNGTATQNVTYYGTPSSYAFVQNAYRILIDDIIGLTGTWENAGPVSYNTDGTLAATNQTTFVNSLLTNTNQVLLAGGIFTFFNTGVTPNALIPSQLRSSTFETTNFCMEGDTLVTLDEHDSTKKIKDIVPGDQIWCGDRVLRTVRRVLIGRGCTEQDLRPRRVLVDAMGADAPNKPFIISGPHHIRRSMDEKHIHVFMLNEGTQVENLADDECGILLYQLMVDEPDVYFFANNMLVSALGPEHPEFNTLSRQ